jgi:hypothetical protein
MVEYNHIVQCLWTICGLIRRTGRAIGRQLREIVLDLGGPDPDEPHRQRALVQARVAPRHRRY